MGGSMLDKQGGGGTGVGETGRIMADPVFRTLVRERTSFAWTMSAVMLAVYLVFILLSAFGKGFMAATIAGSSISWGIVLGLFTIVFAFALTGVYVSRANGRFDELTAKLTRDAG